MVVVKGRYRIEDRKLHIYLEISATSVIKKDILQKIVNTTYSLFHQVSILLLR